MIREIVLDTETTGLDPQDGHRLVEIAGLALVDRLPSGEEYQVYLNPERDVSEKAQAIHGLTTEFLQDQPLFSKIVDEFLSFIGEARLIIHNAEFDLGFLNSELTACGYSPLTNPVTDTLLTARNIFPGAPANLDALCKRFGIDHRHRQKHSALLDCQLLAKVYLELTGGPLGLIKGSPHDEPSSAPFLESQNRLVRHDMPEQQPHRQAQKRPPRPHAASQQEQAAHAEMLKRIVQPLWLDKPS